MIPVLIILPQIDANALPDFIILNIKLFFFLFFFSFLSPGIFSQFAQLIIKFLSSQRTEENIYIYRDFIL